MKKLILIGLGALLSVLPNMQVILAQNVGHPMTVKEKIASREESVHDWTEVLNALQRGKRLSLDSSAYKRAQRALAIARLTDGQAAEEWTTILSALERGKKLAPDSHEYMRVHAARAKSETRLKNLRKETATGIFAGRALGAKRAEKRAKKTIAPHKPEGKVAKKKSQPVKKPAKKETKRAGDARKKPGHRATVKAKAVKATQVKRASAKAKMAEAKAKALKPNETKAQAKKLSEKKPAESAGTKKRSTKAKNSQKKKGAPLKRKVRRESGVFAI